MSSTSPEIELSPLNHAGDSSAEPHSSVGISDSSTPLTEQGHKRSSASPKRRKLTLVSTGRTGRSDLLNFLDAPPTPHPPPNLDPAPSDQVKHERLTQADDSEEIEKLIECFFGSSSPKDFKECISSGNSERRRIRRIPFDKTIEIWQRNETGRASRFPAWGLNISSAGVRVIFTHELTNGERVGVQFRRDRNALNGRVAWVKEQADGYIVGISFITD